MTEPLPRALLVNPWIEDFAAYDFWARPVGLLHLGSALRAAGYEVGLIDCLDVHYPGRSSVLPRRRGDGSGRFDQVEIEKPAPLKGIIPRRFKRYGMPVESFRKILSGLARPDVVMMTSVMTYWYTGVAAAAAELKSAWPEVPIIVGGVYATLMPDHARRSSGADLVAAGDYRACLPPLLAGLGLPSQIPGEYLFPAWDLYPRLEGAAIITGRGCPYRCAYCAVHVLRPRLEAREPGAVVDEIERLARDYSVRDVALFDDSIRAGGDGRLTELLEAVVERRPAVRFHAINAMHLCGLSNGLARLLKRAGFITLRFGLETTDPARAAALGGKASLDDFHGALASLKEAGYGGREIGVYLLAGLPGQGPAEIEAGVREVLRAGARPFLTEYSPVPGSPMWEEAVRSARLAIASEPLFHNNTLVPCARPDLDYDELDRLKNIARGPFRTARDERQ
ncbi:MAG TPA: B12-binding domain-containing radical SAM protein [bacterium]|nr:B12-binding domain-containing radical SAM protein [bacterium]